MFGEPTTWPISRLSWWFQRRERRVYEMGDKSPRSKDKKKKQGATKKEKAKAKRDKREQKKAKLPVVL